MEQCRQIAAQTGASITLTEDAMEGTRDADVICTDVWVSMGEPDSVWEERIELLSPYQVNRRIVAVSYTHLLFRFSFWRPIMKKAEMIPF